MVPKVALESLDHPNVLKEIGETAESLMQFVKYLSEFLSPFKRSRIEIVTSDFPNLKEHIELIALLEDKYFNDSPLDRLADEIDRIHVKVGGHLQTFRFHTGGENEQLSESSSLAWLAHETAEKKLYLVPTTHHNYGRTGAILIIKENLTTNQTPEPETIPFITKYEDSKKWVLDLEGFQYHFSEKHGDGSRLKHGGKDASQFHGHAESATRLFFESIWDKSKSSAFFSYDPEHDKILVFQDENSEGKFHCYHVGFDQANGSEANNPQFIPTQILEKLKECRGR